MIMQYAQHPTTYYGCIQESTIAYNAPRCNTMSPRTLRLIGMYLQPHICVAAVAVAVINSIDCIKCILRYFNFNYYY